MGQSNLMHDVIHDVPKAGKPGRGFGHRGGLGLTEGIEAALQREPRRGRITTGSQQSHTAGSSFRRNWLAWRSVSWLRIRFGPLALAVLLAAPLGPSWADDEVTSAVAAVASEVAQKLKMSNFTGNGRLCY